MIKLGLFRARDNVDVTRPAEVTTGAVLHGSANEVMTQNFITRLRRNRGVEKTLIFLTSDEQEEVGRLTAVFMLKIEGLEDKIYEDVREIEKAYYDPHLSDEAEIQRQLHKVETILDKKIEEYKEVMEKYDKRTEAMRGLAVDLAMLRKQKDEMEAANNVLGRKLEAIQNVNDIHIQIDVLQTTEEGTYQLREKYAKLIKKFYLEKEAHSEYEEKYQALKPKLKELETKKAEICALNKALEE